VDVITLALAKKYTDSVALGSGAVQIPGPPGPQGINWIFIDLNLPFDMTEFVTELDPKARVNDLLVGNTGTVFRILTIERDFENTGYDRFTGKYLFTTKGQPGTQVRAIQYEGQVYGAFNDIPVGETHLIINGANEEFEWPESLSLGWMEYDRFKPGAIIEVKRWDRVKYPWVSYDYDVTFRGSVRGNSSDGGSKTGKLYEHTVLLNLWDKGNGNLQPWEPKNIWISFTALSDNPNPVADWNTLLPLFITQGNSNYGKIACNGLTTFEYGDGFANPRIFEIGFNPGDLILYIQYMWTYTDDSKTPGNKISVNRHSMVMQSDHGNYTFRDYDFMIEDQVREIRVPITNA
jgi:hypothetical protein